MDRPLSIKEKVALLKLAKIRPFCVTLVSRGLLWRKPSIKQLYHIAIRIIMTHPATPDDTVLLWEKTHVEGVVTYGVTLIKGDEQIICYESEKMKKHIRAVCRAILKMYDKREEKRKARGYPLSVLQE